MILININDITKILNTCCQIIATGIFGTWFAMSKLNLGKRKEQRQVDKNTNKQATKFINDVYIPFKTIKDKINNSQTLESYKNKIFYKNNSFLKTPFNQLPNITQKDTKQQLYKHFIRIQFLQLVMWDYNLSKKLVDKEKVFQRVFKYYKWIMHYYQKDLEQLNKDKEYQICYNIYKEMKGDK